VIVSLLRNDGQTKLNYKQTEECCPGYLWPMVDFALVNYGQLSPISDQALKRDSIRWPASATIQAIQQIV